MVQVTEAASAFIRDRLANIPAPEDSGYRLDLSGGRYRLRLDRPSNDDRVIRREGSILLMVAPHVDDQLDDIVLDLKDEGDGLVLEPGGDAARGGYFPD